MVWRSILLGAAMLSSGFAQSVAEPPPSRAQGPGPGRQIGSGVGTIGLGAAKGAGHLALGTAKGLGQLLTLHPIGAGVSIAKGAGTAGKDVTVGTVRGTGKIGKGVGRELKKIP
jgi:hypothetical protein